MIHRSLGPAGRATLLGACALLLPMACGDDDTSDPVDVTAACDQLEDLATAVLEGRDEVRDVESLQEFADAIEEPTARLIEEAEASGDDRLADLAHTYEEGLSIYRTGDGIDAREAGNNADIAMDRAMLRCTELGATNDFPQEPAN